MCRALIHRFISLKRLPSHPRCVSGSEFSQNKCRRSFIKRSLNNLMSNKFAHGEDGFTLIEVIAALAILAFSLSTIFALISNATKQMNEAVKLAEATSVAQSLLARTGRETPLRVGRSTGDLPGGLRWQLQTEPYGTETDRSSWPVNAYLISVEVGWDARAKPVVLTTLRISTKELQ